MNHSSSQPAATSLKRLLLASIASFLVLAGCSNSPAPQPTIIYVTATPANTPTPAKPPPDLELQKIRAITAVKEKVRLGEEKLVKYWYQTLASYLNSYDLPETGEGYSLGDDWTAEIVSEDQVKVVFKLKLVGNEGDDKNDWGKRTKEFYDIVMVDVVDLCPDNPAVFTVLLNTREVLPRNTCAKLFF